MTKSESVELLPCPFCGSGDTTTYSTACHGARVRCEDCATEGPLAPPTRHFLETQANAKVLWNTRTQEKGKK